MFSRNFVMPAVLGLAVLFAAPAQAQVVVNELLGSTTGSDLEFIELYNAGGAPVDISGYEIYLWDSNNPLANPGFGGTDGSSPYIVDPGTILAPGGFWVISNPNADTRFSGLPGDQAFPANSVENSSYTVMLTDATLTVLETILVTDGDPNDQANIGGSPIVPDVTVGPDGSFLPAGFFRTTDGGGTFAFLNFGSGGTGVWDGFDDGTPEGGTPGASNVIPEPATLALLMLGTVGVGIARRQRCSLTDES